MLAYDVTLIDETVSRDDIGQEVITETLTTIQADRESVSRSEFYQAANTGLKPELVLLVHEFEYGGQRLMKFDGGYYTIIRTYTVERDGLRMVELVGERRLGA